MSPSIAEHYRENAEKCREQADRSVSAEQRASWLRLAQEWEALAAQRGGRLTANADSAHFFDQEERQVRSGASRHEPQSK